MAVTAVGVAVGLYHMYFASGGATPANNWLLTPFSMLTFAVALLLVFRTNSSYGRWWEARTIWAKVRGNKYDID
jgi:ion channel-forming bestrophin family protein